MPEYQPALPIIDDGALAPKAGAPFCCFEMSGPPRGKGALKYRVVFPKERWRKAFAMGYTDEETVAYLADLQNAARQAMGSRKPTTCAVQLIIHAFMPIPKSWSEREKINARSGVIRPTSKPDWDNIGKQVDALTKIVWQDDAPIVDGRVIKLYSDEPGLRIEVREMTPGGK